jgi:hypothetical protein
MESLVCDYCFLKINRFMLNTVCGHVFCELCINCLKNANKAPYCPIDRKIMRFASFKNMSRQVCPVHSMELTYFCKNHLQTGCNQCKNHTLCIKFKGTYENINAEVNGLIQETFYCLNKFKENDQNLLSEVKTAGIQLLGKLYYSISYINSKAWPSLSELYNLKIIKDLVVEDDERNSITVLHQEFSRMQIQEVSELFSRVRDYNPQLAKSEHAIISEYLELGTSNLLMCFFLGWKISDIPQITYKIFIVCKMKGEFLLTGLAIGAPLSPDFPLIVNELSIQAGEQSIEIHDERTIYYQPNRITEILEIPPLRIKTNMEIQITISTEGDNNYVFECINPMIKEYFTIQDKHGFAYQAPCPILCMIWQ